MAEKYIETEAQNYALLDQRTGELLRCKYKRKVLVDEFIMLFFASFPELMKLEGQKLRVLMMCWKYSTFSKEAKTNVIVNDQDFKAKIHEYESTISDSNINNCFTDFVKRDILRRVCKGKYELNPKYFFKGRLSDRTRLLLEISAEPQPSSRNKKCSSVSFFSFRVYSNEN